ncbi:MAG TPA: chitinase [Streptosporangiaceae bacterium]|nr:chitinase [Streptosporangiaceae bacterium]
MRPRHRLALTAAAAAAMSLTAVGATGMTALAAARSLAHHDRLPAQVYAPYYETYLAPNTASISAIARRSGASYFTLAFLQTPKKGSCALDWNGTSSQPLGYYAADIARLRRMGGEVIPSFGGYSADHGGTEIADSCTSVSKIAAAYETVIRTLHVTRLDMDVEDNSLTDNAGIARRSEAIRLAQIWAARNHIPLQVQFTIPIEPSGMDSNDMAVLRSAMSAGVRVHSVNIMVFDYYLSTNEPRLNMGAEAVSAATHTHRQLASLYPQASAARLWAMMGMTMLPGIDDYTPAREVTYVPDAQRMLDFARDHRMNFLSIWGIQRDNGGCPGAFDSDTCSGIKQKTWAFSHLLEPFTR